MLQNNLYSNSQKSVGTIYFEKGELHAALNHLLSEKEQASQNKKVKLYFDTCHMLLRVYLEMGKLDALSDLKKELTQFVIEEEAEMSSRLYYTLGICSFIDKEMEKSLKFFNQAFNVALSESNKEDMAYALLGKAGWYKGTQNYEKCISILENLNLFLESIKIPDLETSARVIEAQIYTKLGKYNEALDYLWKAYASANKQHSVQYMNSFVLIQFGIVYTKLGKYELAENYLDLASSQVRENEHIQTFSILKSCYKDLETAQSKDPDLVINLKNNTVKEMGGREIDFKNQFILLSLLVEFVKNKENSVGKQDLASLLWGEDYDPRRHDNKIYVTIRRLRKLIEPDPKKPQYVLRTKDGYSINNNINISLTE